MRHWPRRHRPQPTAASIIGVALVLAGLDVYASSLRERAAYARLDERAHSIQTLDSDSIDTGNERSEEEPLDWTYLRDQSPRIAAWVRVGGTDISLPVLQPPPDDPSFDLTHDFWGEPALEGTPHLDHRCGASDTHRLVFGHHLSTGGQFSALQKAYDQLVFEGIGTCTWLMPDAPPQELDPLCALSKDHGYADIQAFDFPTDEALRPWLADIVSQSSARNPDHERLVASATSVVTLCTCSSERAGQPWRTLVLFVGHDAL